MHIVDILRADHAAIRQLCDHIAVLPIGATMRRDQLFNQLKETLIVHHRTEEQVLYSILGPRSDIGARIDTQHDAHRDMDEMLEELTHPSCHNAEWAAGFDRLRQELYQHMAEEEYGIFSRVCGLLPPRETSGLVASWWQNKRKETQNLHMTRRGEDMAAFTRFGVARSFATAASGW